MTVSSMARHDLHRTKCSGGGSNPAASLELHFRRHKQNEVANPLAPDETVRHFADIPSPSFWKHLLKGEGGAAERRSRQGLPTHHGARRSLLRACMTHRAVLLGAVGSRGREAPAAADTRRENRVRPPITCVVGHGQWPCPCFSCALLSWWLAAFAGSQLLQAWQLLHGAPCFLDDRTFLTRVAAGFQRRAAFAKAASGTNPSQGDRSWGTHSAGATLLGA